MEILSQAPADAQGASRILPATVLQGSHHCHRKPGADGVGRGVLRNPVARERRGIPIRSARPCT